MRTVGRKRANTKRKRHRQTGAKRQGLAPSKTAQVPEYDSALYVLLPTGGLARRCQAKNRRGVQCSAPAREGYDVCARHGAGTRVREERGERKPPGRPPIHGLYSKRGLISIQQLGQELLEAQIDLDNTNAELAMLKATAAYLLNQADEFKDKSQAFGRLAEALLDAENKARAAKDIHAAIELSKGAKAALALHHEIESYVMRVADVLMRIIHASKLRAETRAKMAEAKAQELFLRLVLRLREINLELMDADMLDVWEERVKREILLPNRLRLEAGEEVKNGQRTS